MAASPNVLGEPFVVLQVLGDGDPAREFLSDQGVDGFHSGGEEHGGQARGEVGRDPAGRQLAVAIEELDQLDRGCDLDQPRDAGVARPRGGERDRQIEIDDLDAERREDLRGQKPGRAGASTSCSQVLFSWRPNETPLNCAPKSSRPPAT